MSASKTPELNAKWWSKNRPALMKSTGFGKALEAYEKALTEFDKASLETLEKKFGAVLDHLITELPKAVEAALKVCDPKKHETAKQYLDKYKKTVIPAEQTRVESIFLGRNAVRQRDVQKAEVRAEKFALGLMALLDKQREDQTNLMIAFGGVDKARQAAMKAAKAKDREAGIAAGKVASESIEKARKLYGGMQARSKEALTILKDIKELADEFGGGIPEILRANNLMHSKMENMIKEMGYELADTFKAENELLSIINGSADEAKVMKSTITHICMRYEMNHRELQGTLNQVSAKLGNVESDLMNADERGDLEGQRAVARKEADAMKSIPQKIAAVGKLIQTATQNLRNDVKDFPKEYLKDPAFKDQASQVARCIRSADALELEVHATVKAWKKVTEKLAAVG